MSKPLRGRARRSPSSADTRPPVTILSTAAPTQTSRRVAAPSFRRPTYPEAVARYEAGMRAFQEHRFSEAAEVFRGVLTQYPDEKELIERGRVYLTACERQLRSSVAEPRDQEERLYAATLAMNAGDIDDALRHLEAVVAEDANHDGALYLLGVGHALRHDDHTALMYLQRAIERNPANRLVALRDSDLERLLQDSSIRAAIETAAETASETRRAPHTRSAR